MFDNIYDWHDIANFDPKSVELSPRETETALELVVPAIREARAQVNHASLSVAKDALLRYLLDHSTSATLVGRGMRGRRYVVFSIGDCYVKVLVSEANYSVYPSTVPQLEELLTHHALEHAAISHYFGTDVPDTLFYSHCTDFEDDNQYSKAMKRNPFAIQEGVKRPQLIQTALSGPAAELPQFRDSLVRLLDSFSTMGSELNLVPDVPDFNTGNVLADPHGKVWVVDTNTLVRPTAYHRHGFNFVERVSEIIRQLEMGHVEENPQG